MAAIAGLSRGVENSQIKGKHRPAISNSNMYYALAAPQASRSIDYGPNDLLLLAACTTNVAEGQDSRRTLGR